MPRVSLIGAEYPPALSVSENFFIDLFDEHSKLEPGQGLKGIRLNFAGIPFTSFNKIFASATLSFVSFNITYSNVIVTGRKSPNSLYRQDVVTFEDDSVYDQRDAEGFIKLNALRLKLGKKN